MQLGLRQRLLKLYYDSKCGHIGCSLSCLDLLYVLFDQKNESERIILSKGHAAGALYTVLNQIKDISDSELATFYQDGTKLSAHPSANSFENIPFALGSLGHGFPIACGIALGIKMSKKKDKIFVLMSDGETNEGTTWEAAHFAVAKQLNNLIVVIDRNKLQGFGHTADILGDTADAKKWEAIGFEVIEIDGHNLNEIKESIKKCRDAEVNKPHLIIANTIKGKGVDYMENKMEWHYLPMSEEKYQEALVSLDNNYYA